MFCGALQRRHLVRSAKGARAPRKPPREWAAFWHHGGLGSLHSTNALPSQCHSFGFARMCGHCFCRACVPYAVATENFHGHILTHTQTPSDRPIRGKRRGVTLPPLAHIFFPARLVLTFLLHPCPKQERVPSLPAEHGARGATSHPSGIGRMTYARGPPHRGDHIHSPTPAAKERGCSSRTDTHTQAVVSIGPRSRRAHFSKATPTHIRF